MTGRENIYMNAAILGMTEAETDAKFDDIADVRQVGDFMDTPVGNYSSGMFARLGFSVAVHVDCDVFIADEVLAVGDQPFKKKCMKKMEEIRDSGVTLFYVSHAAQSVRKMCTRVIVLDKGVVGYDGEVEAGIRYLHYDDSEDVDPRTSRPPTPSSAPRSNRPSVAGLTKSQIAACRLAITTS